MTNRINKVALRDLLLNLFSLDELALLALDLRVDAEKIGGDSLSSRVTNLIQHLDRRDRLDELVEVAITKRPNANWKAVIEPKNEREQESPESQAEKLRFELVNLRQQLAELPKSNSPDPKLASQIGELIKLTERAEIRTDDLTAKIILPSKHLTDVPLLPAHMLDQLEEYRSDESKASLLLGYLEVAH